MSKGKDKVCIQAKRPIRSILVSSFSSKTQLGVLKKNIRQYPLIYLGGERHFESYVSCPRKQHNAFGQGSNPDR